MPGLAFGGLEDQLRSFFGRSCRELCSHHADPIDRFVRPVLTKTRPTSLDNLEYSDYCQILVKNLRVDQGEKVVRLFARHVVADTMIADMSYCKALRNKYSHLKGMGEGVSSKEQFSDLIIVRRTVQNILRVRSSSDTDRELLDDLERSLDELLGVMAEGSSLEPVQSSAPSAMSDEQVRDLAALVVSLGAVPQAIASDREGPPSTILIEVREMLLRCRSDLEQLTSQASRQSALVGKVESSSQTLERRLEQLSSEFREVAAGLSSSRQPQSSTTPQVRAAEESPTFEADIDAVLDQLARAQSSRSARQRKAGTVRPSRLSIDEARDELVRLRRRIWSETHTGASANGLLRKSLLEAFLNYRPTTKQEVDNAPLASLLIGVDPKQTKYLPEILSILQRVDE